MNTVTDLKDINKLVPQNQADSLQRHLPVTPEGHNLAQVLNLLREIKAALPMDRFAHLADDVRVLKTNQDALRQDAKHNVAEFIKTICDCTEEIIGLRLEMEELKKDLPIAREYQSINLPTVEVKKLNKPHAVPHFSKKEVLKMMERGGYWTKSAVMKEFKSMDSLLPIPSPSSVAAAFQTLMKEGKITRIDNSTFQLLLTHDHAQQDH